jgi:nitrogen-specific signal transduction histidine kinase/CheY-like chemotaxis protein
MQGDSIRDESLLFQWNFFERTISNYSIIIKMFQHMEEEEGLVGAMPRVFVEETLFDACAVVMRDARGKGRNFFTIDDMLRPVECDDIEAPAGIVFSPQVMADVCGYGTLYVYPLKRSIHVFGYLVLAKRNPVALEETTLRDLELLSEIFNRFILLSARVNESRTAESDRTRQLDSRLATTRTLLENVIDQFLHPLFLIDRKGTICFANKPAREEFFDGNGIVSGEPIENVVQGMEKGFLDKDLILRGELHCRRGDDYKLYSVESCPIKDDTGKIVFKSLILKNVIDLRIEEEEEINRNRMESIGKLAGGVAHDFNNVLTGILGYASLIKRVTEEAQQVNKYADVIESSAKRAATLTEHLLNFSRRQRVKVVDRVDLNALVGDVLFLMRESFRTITVAAEFDNNLGPVTGSAGELQHAILNLCVNAKDSMPEGGTLMVKTEKKSYLGGREFATVTIRDTGSGIDEGVKNKVFEPYFTTKTEGNKLGMGLYLVQKIVREHDGFIELQSDKEKGTAFTLYFPLATAAADKAREKKSSLPRDMGKKSILVVDDEEVVRGLLIGLLTAEGFDVVAVGDGRAAFDLISKRKAPFDLVLLDMIMPGIKGEEVLGELRRRWPGIKVVVSSGYMTEEQRDKLQEYGVDGFLDKPYRDADAISKVASALGSGDEARVAE